MRLIELDPQFLQILSAHDHVYKYVDNIEEADGILFLCPKCLAVPRHSIICWEAKAGLEVAPPGRWKFHGTSYADLTLKNCSEPIEHIGECRARFTITDGEIKMC